MKIKEFLLSLVVVTALFAGCAPKNSQTPQKAAQSPAPIQSPAATPAQKSPPDATTTASIVDNNDAFEKVISKNGTWIIATVKDLTFDKDLVLDGVFQNKKNPPVEQRKLALYTQDDKKNVTGTFTVTAPKLTINSPSAGLWYGTFKGDIYVNAKNFQLIGAKVDGNIYFTTDEAKSTFKMDDKSTVTGEIKK